MAIRSCAILGGGIAGLTVAERLSREGIAITLVERSPFLGGLARRVRVDGGHVDLGPHVIRAKYPEIADYFRDLVGADLIEVTLSAKILFRGALLDYPIRPFEVVRRLPKTLLARCTADLLTEKLKRRLFARELESYEDWAIGNYGRALYEIFFGPLTEKFWAVPAADLDAKFARDRLPSFSLRDVLFGLKPKRGYHPEDPRAKTRFYPKYGAYQFCDALIRRLRDRDIRIVTDAEVTSVQSHPGRGVTLDVRGGGQIEADYLVSTIPLGELLPLHPRFGSIDLPSLNYRGVGFLYLTVPEHVRLPEALVLSAEKEILFTRMSDFSFFSRAVCTPGKNVLCIEFNAATGESFETLSEKSKRVLEAVKALDLVDLSVIHSVHLETARVVYPTYLRGYRNDLARFFELSSGEERLLCVGRQALYSHVNIDDVMWLAFQAASLLLRDPFAADEKRKFYGQTLSASA